ncbi:CU044_2847 family protein [Micromonospora sp. NPDC051925]|uniref:CU044_2847 family protein n=1 Tax=Micromonospora sp. NPDC051925 TaxID=3364288 RepID=UPI0037CC140C
MPGDRFRSMLPEAEEVIGKFAVVAARIAKQVADQAGKPDQLELQFGVKFSAQGKIVLGSASAEGNISVKVIYGSAARVEFEAQDSVDVKDVVE